MSKIKRLLWSSQQPKTQRYFTIKMSKNNWINDLYFFVILNIFNNAQTQKFVILIQDTVLFIWLSMSSYSICA